jgi:membrane-bound ClpP family serine protease
LKNLSLLILLILAAVLFTIGLFIPGTGKPLHVVFVIAGVICGSIFYLLSFIHVIKSPSLTSSRRIFWIVVIVCVPVIGNLIYVIVQDALSRRQVPKQQF